MTGKEGEFQSRGLTLLISRLFGASDFNTGVVNDDYSQISILLRVFNSEETLPIDEKDVINLVEDISLVLQGGLRSDIEWEIKGLGLEFVKLSERMRKDFFRSTILALILISVASSIAFKSLIKGMLALIPLLMGIFSSLILMVLLNIPLDMTTIMVSCITIGVGVDDSIHFLLQHRKMVSKYPGDNAAAIRETVFHAGRPIIITTLSITAGLILLATAQFQPIRYFGLLIVFTLFAACFSTIVLLPSLTGFARKKEEEK
jgi:predicted RND superfamily exporter protein